MSILKCLIPALLLLLMTSKAWGLGGFDVMWDGNSGPYTVYWTGPEPPVRIYIANEVGPSNTIAWADLDGDGDVDGADLALFCGSFGHVDIGPPF